MIVEDGDGRRASASLVWNRAGKAQLWVPGCTPFFFDREEHRYRWRLVSCTGREFRCCLQNGFFLTREDVLRRWPNLIAHLICQSLGYFTPCSAANAVLSFLRREAYWCEWYCHMAGAYSDEKILAVGERTLRAAIQDRKTHHGYMADFNAGLHAVRNELAGHGPLLASWF